ncbi:S8 family serine peptidase [Leptolyngbya sp. GB1-A1]|uniref:S8 family serine peptidase n=1 Tax=Leptolyngbya sp. GB1-A1 TaxID=2933908 RepID=UPI003299C2F0
MEIDRAGNTLRHAKSIRLGSKISYFKDSIGKLDKNDYLRLRLHDRSSLSLKLDRLKANANLQILNSKGRVIQTAARRGKAAERLNLDLGSGTYYIRVYSQQRTETTYQLTLSATPNSPSSSSLPDLRGISFNSPQFLSMGDTAALTFHLENANATVAGGFGVDFYLSTDRTLDSSDRLLGSQAIAGLAGNRTTGQLTATVTLPNQSDAFWQGEGTYYISMVVDPANQVAESNKANNRNQGTPLDSSTIQVSLLPSFTGFSLQDASGDTSENTVFQEGAVQLSYSLANGSRLAKVRLEALKDGSITTLGSWTGASLSRGLVNLANVAGLSGDYEFRAVAQTIEGREIVSDRQSMKVLPWNLVAGTAVGETLDYAAPIGTGSVILGRGGTDVLHLNIERSSISSINGLDLSAFDPQAIAHQAILRGTAFDSVKLIDGREIYFQGIEALRFSNDTMLELQVRPNDPYYSQQWNLRASDVESAWRFTKGSKDVLLVSIDSGVPLTNTPEGSLVDLASTRLITDPTDDDQSIGAGHGHSAISVMSATPNNAEGITGINWNSNVYVTKPYGEITLQQSIKDAISYARANHKRVVLQGGIAGELWLTNGGTQAELEQIFSDCADIAVFAMAAGNGNVDMDDPTNFWESGGIGRLEANHSNVMSVGALARSDVQIINGLLNAAAVRRAGYSNYGSKLTMMAATDSPVMNTLGQLDYFGGTSCANPNMAAIASLVWSVNTNLTGGELRQILTDTAMDLGSAGRDLYFGHGLVNADAAVRRAWALARNVELASLYNGRSLFA